MIISDGYFSWKKGSTELLDSEHFTAREFDCPCTHSACVTQKVSKELIQKLDRIRTAYGAPIKINGGFRCVAHEDDLREQGYETVAAGKLSQHELGNAVDVSGDMSKLLPLLEKEFQAIGVAKTWAHVDLRADRPRRWSYR
jgi:hypothetical protein